MRKFDEAEKLIDNSDEISWSEFLADPVQNLVSNTELANEIRGKQVDNIKRMTPLMMLANAVCLIGAFRVLLGTANPWFLWGWGLCAAAVIVGGMSSVKFRWRVVSNPHPRSSTHRVVWNSFFLAAIWAALPILFFNSADSSQKVLMTCIVAGMMGGGTMALSLIPVAARVFCWTLAMGAFGALIISFDATLSTAALLVLTYAIALSRISAEHGERYVTRFLDEQSIKEQGETISMLLKDFEDSSSDWMWETDREGRIISPSERFCESIGSTNEEIEGTSFDKFVSLPQPRNSSELKDSKLFQRLLRRQIFHNHAVQIDTRNGPRWWNLMGKPLLDKNGKLTGFRGMASDITETKNAQDKLNNLARYDQITGLSNRNSFYEVLTEACAASSSGGERRSGPAFAVLYIDLDKFKVINDSLGHSLGDALLKELASRIQSRLPVGDVAARFGGDEFAVLHWIVAGKDTVEDFSNSLLAHMSRPFLIQGHTISCGGSIGVAFDEGEKIDAEGLLRNADLALYRAKSEGGNTFEVFKLGMDKALQSRRELELDLRSALRSKEFVLHYQPLANVSTGDVNTYEALIRWNHPKRGMLQPNAFIPLAEETGLINDIGNWVLQQACTDAAGWITPHRVAVNVSAKQIMGQRLLMNVIEVLQRTKLQANRLELEVTESVLIENPERTRRLFTELRKLGVSISLDDFGTGYSSLSYLVRFPFDKVKIDKTFIQAADKSVEDLSIIRSILGLANNLGIRTTAEGIESQAQLDIVREEGCDEMQGFLIEKPKAMSDIPELADRRSQRDRRNAA